MYRTFLKFSLVVTVLRYTVNMMSTFIISNLVAILLLTILTTNGTERSSARIWRICPNPELESSPVQLTYFNIEPNPIMFPGNIYFSIEGYTNRTLGSSALHLDIAREGALFNFPVPCIMNIGSCTYNDMCSLLDEMVSDNWMGISRKLALDIQNILRSNGMTPGLCPQPPQTVSILRNRIELPPLPTVLSWLAEGTYLARVRLTDNASGDELVCFDIRINMKKSRRNCSNFWECVFN